MNMPYIIHDNSNKMDLYEIAVSSTEGNDFLTFEELRTLLVSINTHISKAISQLSESSLKNSFHEIKDIGPQIIAISNAISLASEEIANVSSKLKDPNLSAADIKTELGNIVQAIVTAALAASDIKINSEASNLNTALLKNDIMSIFAGLGIPSSKDINKKQPAE